MMNKTPLLTATALTLAAFTGASTADAASVSYTSFSGNNPIPGLSVTVDDSTYAGDLYFTVQVDTTQGYIADILGFYFNVSDDSLVSGLSLISGTDVTDHDFDANSVTGVGGGNNMNGGGGAPYDAGFRFGDNGIGAGKGDYQLVNLRIGAADDLSIDDITRVGVRLQSVGELNSNRGGSSKLFSDTPTTGHAVPTPAAAGLGLAMLGFASLRRRGRGH